MKIIKHIASLFLVLLFLTLLFPGKTLAVTNEKILVIPVKFADQPDPLWSPANATQYFTTHTNSIKNFIQQSSFGRVQITNVDVLDWYTLSNVTCSATTITSQVTALMQAQGINLSQYPYQNRFYLVGPVPWTCPFYFIDNGSVIYYQDWQTDSALLNITVLGRYTWANQRTSTTPKFWSCGNTRDFDPISLDCVNAGLKDRTTITGNNIAYLDFNAIQKLIIGWIPESDPYVEEITESGTYTIQRSNHSDQNPFNPQILKIRRPLTDEYINAAYINPINSNNYLSTHLTYGRYFYLSYKSYAGIDGGLLENYAYHSGSSSLNDGISIYDVGGGPSNSSVSGIAMVDASPGNKGIYDDDSYSYALEDNQHIYDVQTGITIKQLSHTSTTATVEITMPPSPQNHWKLDESNPLYDCENPWGAVDAIDNRNGSLCPSGSGSKSAVSGKFNNAMSFDGVADRVKVTNNQSLTPASFTVSMWVKPLSYTGSYPRIISKNGSYELIMYTTGNAPGRLELDIKTRTPELQGPAYENDIIIPEANKLNLNTWYHLAASFDDTTKIAKVYINGQKVAEQDDIIGSIPQTSHPLIFAGQEAQRFANIVMDDIRLYNLALTDNQVNVIYTTKP